MHSVKIKAVLNGWVVRVGCQKVVFTDLNTLLEELGNYLENPDKTMEEYMKESVNATLVKRNNLTSVGWTHIPFRYPGIDDMIRTPLEDVVNGEPDES